MGALKKGCGTVGALKPGYEPDFRGERTMSACRQASSDSPAGTSTAETAGAESAGVALAAVPRAARVATRAGIVSFACDAVCDAMRMLLREIAVAKPACGRLCEWSRYDPIRGAVTFRQLFRPVGRFRIQAPCPRALNARVRPPRPTRGSEVRYRRQNEVATRCPCGRGQIGSRAGP